MGTRLLQTCAISGSNHFSPSICQRLWKGLTTCLLISGDPLTSQLTRDTSARNVYHHKPGASLTPGLWHAGTGASGTPGLSSAQSRQASRRTGIEERPRRGPWWSPSARHISLSFDRHGSGWEDGTKTPLTALRLPLEWPSPPLRRSGSSCTGTSHHQDSQYTWGCNRPPCITPSCITRRSTGRCAGFS